MNSELIRVLLATPTPSYRVALEEALPPDAGYEIVRVDSLEALGEESRPGIRTWSSWSSPMAMPRDWIRWSGS